VTVVTSRAMGVLGPLKQTKETVAPVQWKRPTAMAVPARC
jgi:hypothetical protein